MSSTEAVIVVRDLGESWVAEFAKTLVALGVRPLLVTDALTRSQRATLDQHFAEIVEGVDPFSAVELEAAARKLGERWVVLGLTTASDGVLVPTATAAHRLGLRADPADAFELARDKHRMRRTLARHGRANPPFALVRDAAELPDAAARVGLPAVLKPIAGTAGHGVERVETLEQLIAAHARVTATVAGEWQLADMYAGAARAGGATAADPRHALLLEGTLVGPEVCVDVVVRGDEVELTPIIDKFLLDERFFECGFRYPTNLDDDTAARVVDEVRSAIRALGLRDTVAHVEVIVDAKRGPTIVEVNAGRQGGQLLGELLRLVAGVDMLAETVALATRRPAPPRQPAQLAIPLATLSVFPTQDGRLLEIRGLDKVADLDDVIGVYPLVTPGTWLSTAFEIFAVVLLASAADGDEALSAMRDEAVRLIEFVVDPEARVNGSRP